MVVTGSTERRDALVRRQVLGGAVIGAFEAFLALRGLRTLPVRLARAQATAMDLAQRLSGHPSVTKVRYPGLTDDPGHQLALSSMTGPGAVLSFETVGEPAALDRALAELRVITSTTSLGGVESTIERRARLEGQEHVPSTLCRLSVGCEHAVDLWGDLDHVLGKLRL
jgi:cystathionine gamma-synthase